MPRRPRTIMIDGRPYVWAEIVELRRQQIKASRTGQPCLFEMRDDARPKSQRKADGRFSEPTLF